MSYDAQLDEAPTMQHNGHRNVNGVYTCIQEMYREIGRTDMSCAKWN